MAPAFTEAAAELEPRVRLAKVDDLMHSDLRNIQQGNPNPAVKEEILGLGLRYQLLTQLTSFVAVEHLKITEGGESRTVAVPVEMPEGVSYEGVFGPGPMPVAGSDRPRGRDRSPPRSV
jgi:hypothetical protein